jgi:hypothetical protein
MGWAVNTRPRPLYPRYPLYRRVGWPQGRSGRVTENLAPTGIRFPDHPVRSESLYRLRYLNHLRGNRGKGNDVKTAVT